MMPGVAAMLAAVLGAAQPAPIAPNGRRVTPVDQCFTIERGGKPVGTTRQIVRSTRFAGRPAWDIVVHQRVPVAAFDLRDHFILARSDLSPIAFDNRKAGLEHVRLIYRDGRITGSKTEGGNTTPIDLTASGPVWEGNLWGVTFGALPLASGATFTLPFYQYDQGFGHFALTVTGEETVATPAGAVAAWTVEAGTNPARRLTYLIDKRTGVELGSRAPGYATRLGGDCSGLD